MKKIIHNIETGEIIETDFTEEELKQNEIEKAEYAKQKNEEALKLIAKKEILKKLGLTEDELELLLA